MCGIAGLFARPGSRLSRQDIKGFLQESMEMLAHRGPDETVSLITDTSVGTAGLCMARLAVIDLSRGLYPLSNEKGTLRLVLNGEIYNFPQLRRDLEGKGHTFNTCTDGEVIIHLYEEKGLRLVEDLEGMFAFALLDEERGRLLLARDRMGQKPLYLCRKDGTFYFASELRPLARLVLRQKSPFDEDSFSIYLRFGYVPGRKSIVNGIERLLPGELRVIDRQEESIRFHEFVFRPGGMELQEALERLERVLSVSVEQRLVSDRPLGLFLSRGIDSGLVASFSPKGRDGAVAYTAGSKKPEFDERASAERVASRLGLVWKPLEVPEPSPEIIPELAWAVDEPMADSSFLPTWMLCREASREIVVALSGDGGDELFGGYERYQAGMLGAKARYLRRPAAAAAGLMETLTPNRGRRLRRFLDALGNARGAKRRQALGNMYERIAAQGPPEALAALTGRNEDEFLEAGPIAAAVARAPAHTDLDALCWADLTTYLPWDILHKVDRASMSHGLEVRSPFLDRRVEELGLSLPSGLKVGGMLEMASGRGGKKLLRRLYARRVGEGAWIRKKGFGVPLAEWFKGDAGLFAQNVFSEGTLLGEAGLIRDEGALTLLSEHRGGVDRSYLLWAALIAECWLRRYRKEL